MRIAKPMLLTSTPIGVVWGLYEAFKIHWWLGGLMAVLIGVISGFSWLTVSKIRHEQQVAIRSTDDLLGKFRAVDP